MGGCYTAVADTPLLLTHRRCTADTPCMLGTLLLTHHACLVLYLLLARYFTDCTESGEPSGEMKVNPKNMTKSLPVTGRWGDRTDPPPFTPPSPPQIRILLILTSTPPPSPLPVPHAHTPHTPLFWVPSYLSSTVQTTVQIQTTQSPADPLPTRIPPTRTYQNLLGSTKIYWDLLRSTKTY